MNLKRLILPLAIILFSFVSRAQLIMIDGETGDYKYEDVVSVDGVSKSQIMERSNQWIKEYYDASTPIETDSMGKSEMVKFEFKWKFIQKNIPIELFYDVKVQAKDNRYKYTISNFKIGKTVNGNIDAYPLKTYIERFPTKYQINIEEPIDAEITKALKSLEYFVVNGKLKDNKDDW
jgi:hypothetical protein